MKHYLKIYCITALGSALCIAFTWILAAFGVLTEMDVMECYSIVAGVVALVFAVIYVFRQVKPWKPRLIIILLNPAIYYIIAVICFGIMLSLGPWKVLG